MRKMNGNRKLNEARWTILEKKSYNKESLMHIGDNFLLNSPL